MKLLPVIAMCCFLFSTSPTHAVVGQVYIGQEKIEVTTLPIYRVLTVVQDSIQKMHNDSSFNDVFTDANETVKRSLVLLTSCVDAINNNVLYEYGEILDRFMGMILCVGDFGVMPEPYILREFRRVIKEFDIYLTTFVASRAAFLSPKAKNTFENMTSLNQLLLTYVLNDEHFSWGFFDYLDDYVVSRPLEFVQEQPMLVSSVVLVIIASVIYCCWEKAPLEKKDDIQNHEITDEINNNPKQHSKDSGKKLDNQKIHDELKPVIEKIKKAFADKKVPFLPVKEFNVLLQNNQNLGLSIDAQTALHEAIVHGGIFLPDRLVSPEKLNKAFDDKLESLKKNK